VTGLGFLHDPRVVAVIGASDDGDKVGGRPIRYMHEFGFTGTVLPVNAKRDTVQGLPAYRAVSELPAVPDVALIALPGTAAVEAVTACADLGVKGCIVMAAGFGETDDPQAQLLQREMVTAARRAGMRVVGPNTHGLANFATGAVLGFSTMFSEQPPADGPVAIVSQSGAMCSIPYGLLRRRGIGIRYAHGTGNDADVTVAELAEAVVSDPAVRLLLLYLEDIRDRRGLEAAARTALERGVPVVALMGGRSEHGQQAARSHTGALASEQRVVDAFFERHGIWRARSTRELLEATELYLQGWQPRGRKLAVASNSGAVCVLAADIAADHHLPLASFTEDTRRRLDAVLPRFATKINPVDITAALLTDSTLVGKVLDVLADDPAADACLVGIPVAGQGYDVPQFAADAARFARASNKPLVIAAPQPSVADEFRRAGLVVFDEESGALSALAQFLRHHELLAAARSRQPLPAMIPCRGAGTLNEHDSLAVLRDAGVPVVPIRLCASPVAAAEAFDEFGGQPVVVKGCTAQLTHKSEHGLVRLGLDSRKAVERAAADLLRAMTDQGVEADGVLVCPMVRGVREVLVGAHHDPVFGPVVVLGAGGKYVEALPDVRLLLPPLTSEDVLQAIGQLHMAPLLSGVRGEPGADVEAWAEVAVRIGELVLDPNSRISSVDANPVILGPQQPDADGAGAVVVDAVVITSITEVSS
jgi:acyl-CoA synthetase (NDP forming)